LISSRESPTPEEHEIIEKLIVLMKEIMESCAFAA